MISDQDLRQVEDLQIKYVSALDRRDLDSWLGCFSPDGQYLCISKENVEQDLPLAIMMDDCGARLQDRVTFIREIWAGTFEDYSTRHFVQRLSCTGSDKGVYAVKSNFMVVYTSRQGQSEILVAGLYEDEVAIEGGACAFKSKKAILDTITTPRYLVYPV